VRQGQPRAMEYGHAAINYVYSFDGTYRVSLVDESDEFPHRG
jgi:hypothetical protein